MQHDSKQNSESSPLVPARRENILDWIVDCGLWTEAVIGGYVGNENWRRLGNKQGVLCGLEAAVFIRIEITKMIA